MLRVHLMQQWKDLSEPAIEDTLIEVATMHRFAGIALITDWIPDEATILTFQYLLDENDLGAQFFKMRRLTSGPRADSILISA
jgi:IS5 family transposase